LVRDQPSERGLGLADTVESRSRLVEEPSVEAVLGGSGRSRPPTLTASERKTGVKRAEVITVRLVQDERGWLRLAG
jgi:hypothetical protein